MFSATVGGLCGGEREITVHRQDAAVLGSLRPAKRTGTGETQHGKNS